jgi:hypothetical protein
MEYPTCVKLPGTATPSPGNPRKVVCFVRYCDRDRYEGIVSDSFRDHYQLDLEQVRRDRPADLRLPHNIAFAILTYRYFQQRWESFSLDNYEFVSVSQLPAREPDASDDDFALWVDPAPDSGPPHQPELTRLKWT